MLTTQRLDQRTRRQAQFQVECLDERLVLSTAAASAVGAHMAAVMNQLEARLAVLEANHGSQMTPAESRIEARITHLEARLAHSVSSPVMSPAVAAPITISGPIGAPAPAASQTSSASATAGTSTTTVGTTGPIVTTPGSPLPHTLITGPDGTPIGIVRATASGDSTASGGSADTTTVGTTSPDSTSPIVTTPGSPLPHTLITGPDGTPIGVVR
jgi:hypothetical protein